MSNFIEWQVFENKELNVLGIDEIKTINISRDENYNILFSIYSSIQPQKNNVLSDSLLSHFNELIAYDKNSQNKYVLKKLIVENITFSNSNNTVISGKVLSMKKIITTENTDLSEFEIIWLLNSSNTVNYDQNIEKVSRVINKYIWGDFANDTFDYDSETSLSWSGLKLSYNDFSFLFVKADAFAGLKASFLRFEKKHIPNNEIVHDIITILSYLFGITFICIGITKYSIQSLPLEITYISTLRFDIKQVLNENSTPPVPIRFIDFYKSKIRTTEIINLFISNFIKNESSYQLHKNLAYINYARLLPAEMKIATMSAVFDNLCTNYFISKVNTIIPIQKFNEIKKVLNSTIDELIDDDEQNRILKSKVCNINNKSINQRNKEIFSDLKMNLSEFEKKSLTIRNLAVHGNLDSDNTIEILQLSNCYYWLINRLLLKLIGIDYYIDYSSKPNLPEKTENSQKGAFLAINFLQDND
ncbi:MAG: hypothetical protein J5747_05740 [Spirochaetaceae bacterium]|nr:hypothetical protein [Spirochaetaceae bacterium]